MVAGWSRLWRKVYEVGERCLGQGSGQFGWRWRVGGGEGSLGKVPHLVVSVPLPAAGGAAVVVELVGASDVDVAWS